MNFLESLVAEWYEYRGYLVRSNLRTRKRKQGGYDVELDVLAYLPSERRLVHIETSGDALSWPQRKERFLTKKFNLTREDYETLHGASVDAIEKIVVVEWCSSTKSDLNWRDDIEVVLIPQLFEEITTKLRTVPHGEQAVPEKFPRLLTIQAMLRFEKQLFLEPSI